MLRDDDDDDDDAATVERTDTLEGSRSRGIKRHAKRWVLSWRMVWKRLVPDIGGIAVYPTLTSPFGVTAEFSKPANCEIIVKLQFDINFYN